LAAPTAALIPDRNVSWGDDGFLGSASVIVVDHEAGWLFNLFDGCAIDALPFEETLGRSRPLRTFYFSFFFKKSKSKLT
jgi:hypothetical protein